MRTIVNRRYTVFVSYSFTGPNGSGYGSVTLTIDKRRMHDNQLREIKYFIIDNDPEIDDLAIIHYHYV